MKITRDISAYLFKEQLEIKVFKDKVNIVNYNRLGTFDNCMVSVYHNSGKVIVHGNNLVVSKLLDNEILIIGKITSIELGE